MIRTDELKLVYLEETEEGMTLSLPRSADDLAQRRSSAFKAIRQKSGFIPNTLLELVLVELKEQTPVQMVLRRTSGPVQFKVEVKVVNTESRFFRRASAGMLGPRRSDTRENAVDSKT